MRICADDWVFFLLYVGFKCINSGKKSYEKIPLVYFIKIKNI